MKTLTLLRHAKSGWDDPVTRDFDRPLNRRGRRAARTVGAEMRKLGLAFDRVLASPARRVVETLEEVAEAFGPLEPHYEQRLYLATIETLIELLRAIDESVESLLLVGHNPGMECLALALSGGSENSLRGEFTGCSSMTAIRFAASSSSWRAAPASAIPARRRSR